MQETNIYDIGSQKEVENYKFFMVPIQDGSEIIESGRVTVNREHAAHGSYELVIHKVGEITLKKTFSFQKFVFSLSKFKVNFQIF